MSDNSKWLRQIAAECRGGLLPYPAASRLDAAAAELDEMRAIDNVYLGMMIYHAKHGKFPENLGDTTDADDCKIVGENYRQMRTALERIEGAAEVSSLPHLELLMEIHQIARAAINK